MIWLHYLSSRGEKCETVSFLQPLKREQSRDWKEGEVSYIITLNAPCRLRRGRVDRILENTAIYRDYLPSNIGRLI